MIFLVLFHFEYTTYRQALPDNSFADNAIKVNAEITDNVIAFFYVIIVTRETY